MTITRNLGGWFEYALMAARRVYIYRFNTIFSILLTGVTIYLLTVVWTSAYAGRTEVVLGFNGCDSVLLPLGAFSEAIL